MDLTKIKNNRLIKSSQKTKDTTHTRTNRSNGRFGQAKLKHSKKGVSSCIYAACVWTFLFLFLILAFVTSGGAPSVIGAFAMLSIVFAVIGFNTAIRGFREREKNYLTCRIGMIANGLVILAYIMLFIRGLA